MLRCSPRRFKSREQFPVPAESRAANFCETSDLGSRTNEVPAVLHVFSGRM